jgi:hypothetical protein
MKRGGPLLAGICALILFGGCGRSYRLIGRVVTGPVGAWTVGIHEVTGKAMPEVGVPIEGAAVLLVHELTRDGDPVRTSTWNRDVTTNADGSFDLFSYATPSRKMRVGLEVTAAGYATEYTTYIDYHDPDEQYFFIVLRPER